MIELPERAPAVWADLLTGRKRHWRQRIPLAEVFSGTPVGLLATTDEPDDRNNQ